MGEKVNFSYKEISEEPPSTTESVEEVEDKKIIAEFQNEVKMLSAYEKIGAMEYIGDLTEIEMANLLDKTENTKKIRGELIPEQFVGKNGAEYRVYRATENYDPESSEAREIAQNEYNCYVEIQKKTAEEYDSLVESGKMTSLGILTPKELTKHKTKNNITNKNIKEIPCFDENNNITEGVQFYYEIID